jgi:nucleoside-diphosphate-sugar epimerase
VKILVIGNGFIAGAIIRKLESQGHELLIFSRSAKSGIGCKQIVGDILNYNDFAQTLTWKPQVIIHTAWVTTHDRYGEDSSNLDYANFTIKLATSIASASVEHLIVLGTCAEYGPQSVASAAGITSMNPLSLYAKQKVLAFNSTKKILAGTNIRFSWARVFHPYGPNQDEKRLIPYLINSIKSGDQVNLFDTTTILDWITTRDIASAISWIINNDAPIELDIGTSFGYTNLDLLRHLEELVGNSNQWERLTNQVSMSKQVSVVGKGSPLFSLGWRSNDSLNQGLEWVLHS